MKSLFQALIICILLTSCSSKKNTLICGSASLAQREGVESEVVQFQTTGIADTSIVIFSGQVFGVSKYNELSFVDTLSFSQISVRTSFDSTRSYGVMSGFLLESNLKGFFSFSLFPGVYDVEISYGGYKSLRIKNMEVTSGEIKELNVILGQGEGETVYLMKDDNTFIKYDNN